MFWINFYRRWTSEDLIEGYFQHWINDENQISFQDIFNQPKVNLMTFGLQYIYFDLFYLLFVIFSR